jgi:hypothetical protein
MSDDKRKPTKGLNARALVLGVSLGTIAIAGSVMPAAAQSEAEEACAALFSLRSPFTIERVIRRFADDPCIPVMLANLPPNVLSRLDPEVIEALSPQQRRRIPQAVLDLIGVEGTGAPQGTSRSISNPYGY